MTKIKLTLAIYGDDFSPSQLTKIVNILPTNIWIKGDSIPNRKTSITRKETNWEFSQGYFESIDLEYVSNQLFDIIKPQIKLFQKFIQEYRLSSKLYIILEIENDEKPSLFIDKQMMEILILLNGEIDIDLYLLNNN
jgi:hypothetical protein